MLKRAPRGSTKAHVSMRLSTTSPPFSTIGFRPWMLTTPASVSAWKRRVRYPRVKQTAQPRMSRKTTRTSAGRLNAYRRLKLNSLSGR